jgi:hypothetical protein
VNDAVTVTRKLAVTARNGKHDGNGRNGRNGDNQQHIGVASGLARSSAAVRYAAQAAGQAAELIEFPPSRRRAEVTKEPVTEPVMAPSNPRPSLPAHSGGSPTCSPMELPAGSLALRRGSR